MYAKLNGKSQLKSLGKVKNENSHEYLYRTINNTKQKHRKSNEFGTHL